MIEGLSKRSPPCGGGVNSGMVAGIVRRAHCESPKRDPHEFMSTYLEELNAHTHTFPSFDHNLIWFQSTPQPRSNCLDLVAGVQMESWCA